MGISEESVLPAPAVIKATKRCRVSTTSDQESPRREKGPESFSCGRIATLAQRCIFDVRHVPRECTESGQGGEPAFDDTADEPPPEVLAVVVVNVYSSENAMKRKETFSWR